MPTLDENRQVWGRDYDWSRGGEEWTNGKGWKEWILAHTLVPYLKPHQRVLEIGPGAGRWTAELLKHEPASLTLVDLVEATLKLCRRRFVGVPNLTTFVNDGRSLDFIPERSIDFIWSFDCFVHIEKEDTEAYFAHFRRVLAPGGLGIVHYPTLDRCADKNRPNTGWRARMTSADMFEILAKNGLELVADMFHRDLSNEDSSLVVFK